MIDLDSSALKSVKHILLVLSGKGGVGKSSVSVQLSLSLLLMGFRVGLLDIDLTGPSIPYLLGLEGCHIYQSSSGWVPVHLFVNNPSAEMKVVSIGFLLPNRGDAVIWRGSKKTSMIQQLLSRVEWGILDFLVIDSPPGTGDEQIAVAETLHAMSCIEKSHAIIVTTPQEVSLADVRKGINFCRKAGLNIFGIIENMSTYRCPHCFTSTDIFSSGGGEELSKSYEIPLLGKIPLDSTLSELIKCQPVSDVNTNENISSSKLLDESNWDLPERYKKCTLYPLFKEIVNKIL
ncbi:hypothetical protein T552_01990 [Pneumocystis carinii B80]|uniref:Cytosolic Fe-S cluster assembly factor CFD1 n=1 Tax=Pneumocystis carinii (strain B80) TaxID=1408658 RepID=A0A0W4ZIC9_PNEC8|nr:hypothetical protein T552_01990 [Pneumocystis carinii B80]KTW28131.1 hypothetical protein T552_01990 [Pneumocystis carinii B80]